MLVVMTLLLVAGSNPTPSSDILRAACCSCRGALDLERRKGKKKNGRT